MRAKPRVFFKCKNITDALLVTNEWYDIDDMMNAQVEKFKDKNVFDANKDKNIAQSFIARAEKLFKDNGVGVGDNSPDADLLIEVLRKEIKNQEQWQIFMQTLRLSILTFRAGFIPEMAQEAVKEKRRQKEKAEKRRTNKNGLSPEEQDKRNQKILAAFLSKKVTVTANDFYIKQGKKHNITPSAVRVIVESKIVKP